MHDLITRPGAFLKTNTEGACPRLWGFAHDQHCGAPWGSSPCTPSEGACSIDRVLACKRGAPKV